MRIAAAGEHCMNRENLSRAWMIVAMLWLVALLNYFDRLMLTTMRLSIKDAIPMTDAEFGLLTSVFLWVYAGLSPFGGYLADRFNRSRVIIGSLLFWSLVTFLTGQARTFHQLLAARALMGVSEAAYIPAALALIADYHRGSTRSLATGIHETGIFIGSAIGGLGGWLAMRCGWSFSFTVFGVVGIVYSVLLAFTLTDAPAGDRRLTEKSEAVARPKLWEAMVSLCSERDFFCLAGYWGLLGIAGWAIVGWLPSYLNERFQLDQGTAGLSATGYLFVAAFFGVLFGGWWADRWSRTNERGRVLVTLIGLCIAAPAVLVAAQTDVLVVAIVGMTIYGFTRVFGDANMMPMLCLVSDPRYRATGYGVINMVSCGLGGVAIYAGGKLMDHGMSLSVLFLFSAGIMVVCALLLVPVRPRRLPDQCGI
jgi:MFS family permease